MRTLRRQYERLVRQVNEGTYAAEFKAHTAMLALVPQLSAYGFQLVESGDARERVYGCIIFLRLLHASWETGDPDPEAVEAGVPVWIRLTRDVDEEVRSYGARFLARIRREEDMPTLCALAEGNDSDRAIAAEVLCAYNREFWESAGSKRYLSLVIETLLRLSRDRQPDTRGTAVFSLQSAQHDTPEVRDRLLDALDDPDARVRAASAQTLGLMGEARLIPTLEARLRDETEVRQAGWGYFDAVRSLNLAQLLPAAEVGAEFARRYVAERGKRLFPSHIDDTLARLRGTTEAT